MIWILIMTTTQGISRCLYQQCNQQDSIQLLEKERQQQQEQPTESQFIDNNCHRHYGCGR